MPSWWEKVCQRHSGTRRPAWSRRRSPVGRRPRSGAGSRRQRPSRGRQLVAQHAQLRRDIELLAQPPGDLPIEPAQPVQQLSWPGGRRLARVMVQAVQHLSQRHPGPAGGGLLAQFALQPVQLLPAPGRQLQRIGAYAQVVLERPRIPLRPHRRIVGCAREVLVLQPVGELVIGPVGGPPGLL
jgi:hypothetical protein